jgi:hypothetical protein
MLRDLAWTAVDTLTRAQLAVFHASCDRIGLRDEQRCSALGLDSRKWAAWQDFMDEGPLPAEPSLPEMLLRLGVISFWLVAVEAGGAPA